MLEEFEVKKLYQIIDDCQSYVNRKRHMPLSFNLTRREFLICQKARKEGIRLTVKFNDETRPIPLTKGYLI